MNSILDLETQKGKAVSSDRSFDALPQLHSRSGKT